ncbi:MAG: helix-turn-helix domain-containing protein [Rhizonema sp. PD37]|nr:helix-turn-helix domain-containing protein [Rhizonema sp. PD37]
MPTTTPSSTPDLVRELRQQCNFSRERSASVLGVSFKTVNRWKNGHSTPSSMTLKLMKNQREYNGCTRKSILESVFPRDGAWR